MKRSAKLFYLVFGLTLICSVVLFYQTCTCYGESVHYVKYVIDGDTIVLENGSKVRYLGINAPEIPHKDSTGEKFGIEAAKLNRELALNKNVIIVQDSEKKDRFGRILAWVYLDDKRLVNEILVSKGLAHVCFHKESNKNRRVLIKAQNRAISSRYGIWSLPALRPEAYYIGNRRSLRLHRPSCKYGIKTSLKNRIIFHDRLDAYRKGYCRCKKCLP